MTVNFQSIYTQNQFKKPFIVAGPCSIESREQLFSVVQDITPIPQVQFLRCGIWKPRTRPGGFEGVREEGLKWIREIKKQYNIKVCVEVASVQHVEACLDAGIDMLWIGARTSGNPFSVQELANALRGTDIPVMVKNPMNPDLKLWVGALERFYESGSRQLMAIHRGFHLFNNNSYRNNPCWEIPIELKRLAPNLPLLCDPSHIAGKSYMIKEIAQTAMDLDFDGLMIEVHPCPENAFTDAEQQITPKQLDFLISELIIRNSSDMDSGREELHTYRTYIDILDKELIGILKQRMEISEEVSKYKKEHNLTILQLNRWNQILEERLQMAENMGLSIEFVKKILELIHTESIRIQNEALNKQ